MIYHVPISNTVLAHRPHVLCHFRLIRLHWLNWLNEVEYYSKHFYLFTLWLNCLLHASTDKYKFWVVFLIIILFTWLNETFRRRRRFIRPTCGSSHPFLFSQKHTRIDVMQIRPAWMEIRRREGRRRKAFRSNNLCAMAFWWCSFVWYHAV